MSATFHPAGIADFSQRLEELDAEVRAVLIDLAHRVDGRDDDGEWLTMTAASLRVLCDGLTASVRVAEASASRVDEVIDLARGAARFRAETVDDRMTAVAAMSAESPRRAGRRWASEILAALSFGEDAAVARMLGEPVTAALADGSQTILQRQVVPGLQPSSTAAERSRAVETLWEELGRHGVTPRRSERGPLAVVRAVLRRRAGDPRHARRILDEELRAGEDPLVLAERAALDLADGDVERAAEQSQRAANLFPSAGECELVLGACEEARGEDADATQRYGVGCARLGTEALASWGATTSFLPASALLDLERAKELRDRGRPRTALIAIDTALSSDRMPRGTSRATARELRFELLDDLADPRAVDAAGEAGRELIDGGDYDRAVGVLERAVAGESPASDAGWLLARARREHTVAADPVHPERGALARAREGWWEWHADHGSPRPEHSWAYRVLADIVEDLMRVGAASEAASADWEAVLLGEKALLLDSADASNWARTSRALRGRSLGLAAREASEEGFRLDPDADDVLRERLANLCDAGAYAAARATLDRMPTKDTDPWLRGLAAWLRAQEGDPAGAVAMLDLPIAFGHDLGWYLELRSRCSASSGDVEGAEADLRRILDEVDEEAPRAGALVQLGRIAEARRLLDDPIRARHLDEGDELFLRAAVGLVEGPPDAAADLVEAALRHSRNEREAGHQFEGWVMMLRLRDRRGSPAAVDEGGLAEIRTRRWPSGLLTADEANELAEAVGRAAGTDWSETVRIATSAIRARRHVAAGEPENAARVYRSLRGTVLDPEATRGLRSSVSVLLRAAVEGGDADRARSLYDELAALGATPGRDRALMLAEAYRRAGRLSDAAGILMSFTPEATDPSTLLAVRRELGEIWMRSRDLDATRDILLTALEQTRSGSDETVRPLLQIRIGLAALLAGDRAQCAHYFGAALGDWRSQGAVSPAANLRHEIRFVTLTAADADVEVTAREIGEDLIAATDRAGEPERP